MGDDQRCGHPCPPEDACAECSPYWDAMIRQGFWDYERREWTEKGWKEIMK